MEIGYLKQIILLTGCPDLNFGLKKRAMIGLDKNFTKIPLALVVVNQSNNFQFWRQNSNQDNSSNFDTKCCQKSFVQK